MSYKLLGCRRPPREFSLLFINRIANLNSILLLLWLLLPLGLALHGPLVQLAVLGEVGAVGELHVAGGALVRPLAGVQPEVG